MTEPPDPARPRPRRKFTLGHAMALVAAIALTLAIPPAIMRASVTASFGDPSRIEWYPPQIQGSITLTMALWSFVAAVAILSAGGRRRRRASRTWGGAAVLASTLAIVGMDLGWVLDLFVLRRIGGLQVAQNFEPLSSIWWGQIAAYMTTEIPRAGGLAVLGAWTVLAFGRVARKPSGRLEIAGFLLGLAWIIWPVIHEYVRFTIICRYILHLFP